MKKLIEIIKDSKEIVGAVIAIFVGVFFVTDYFATKIELAVLKCQMQNSIDQTDSQLKIDKISRQIISLELERTPESVSVEKKTEIGIEINKLNQNLIWEHTRQKTASSNLAPEACHKIVKEGAK